MAFGSIGDTGYTRKNRGQQLRRNLIARNPSTSLFKWVYISSDFSYIQVSSVKRKIEQNIVLKITLQWHLRSQTIIINLSTVSPYCRYNGSVGLYQSQSPHHSANCILHTMSLLYCPDIPIWHSSAPKVEVQITQLFYQHILNEVWIAIISKIPSTAP